MPEPSDPSAPLSTEQRRWRINILAATWISYAGFYFCRKVFGIVKTDLAETYGFSDPELAQIWTAFLVAYVAGQFISAALGRRITCRSLLLLGMGTSLVTTAITGWLSLRGQEAMVPMMVFMVINGVAQATGWPGNIGLLSKWTRRHERGTLVALWATCYQIGSILAKHFAAFVLALAGIAWSFWAASLVLLAIWAFFLWKGKDRPEDVGLPPFVDEVIVDRADATTGPAPLPTERLVAMVVAMGLNYFCFKFIRYAIDSWGPMILAETFNLSGATAGHISTTFDWVGFTGVIAAGIASDRLFASRRTPVMVLMSVGMCLCCVALWLFGTQSVTLFAVLIGLVGFCLMGPDSLLSGTAAMEVGNKEFAVVASGVINGLGSVGPVVQELVIGWLKGAHGVNAVLILLVGVSALAVLGTGMLWWVSRRLKLGL